VALYGLLLFYGLTKTELAGKRPVAKFLSIKLVIMFSFYQSFVVRCRIAMSVIFADMGIGRSSSSGHWKGGSYMVIFIFIFFFPAPYTTLLNIPATQFWTTSNIANGLNALAICIEVYFYFTKWCR
jgi:hypothetical protein